MSDIIRHGGRWLEFHETSFRDAHGHERSWEFVRRRESHGACSILAVTREDPPRLALVRQFRPPIAAWILELPAGLIEPGADAGETALRELAEETGCQGLVRAVGPFIYNSPGLTDEKVSLVQVEVTSVGRSRPEADEAIEVVWAPLRGLVSFLRSHEAAGTRIDAKLWCLAQGMNLGRDDAGVADPA